MALDKLFNQLLSSPGTQGALSGAASAAAVTALLNKKTRKKLVNSTATLGGLAALAGVGYVAYKKWQSHSSSASGQALVAENGEPVPAESTPMMADSPPVVSDSVAMKMLMAMIAAAHADGQVDEAEMDQLVKAVESSELSVEEHNLIMSALNTPPTLDAITQGVDNPEAAAEIFGSAVMAIENDTPSEQFFLKRLAKQLGIDPGLEAEILRSVR